MLVDEEDVDVSDVVVAEVDEAAADDEDEVVLPWADEVDFVSVGVGVTVVFEDFVLVLKVLVAAGSTSAVDVSSGSTTAEVAAAVPVNGSSRLSIPLSSGSKRKDMLYATV